MPYRSAYAIAVAAILAGCAASPRESVQVRYFDFGPEPAASLPRVPVVLQVANFSAPDWLESTTIPYRFLDREPQVLHTYASSRWVAPPNLMLTFRLKRALGSGGGVVGTTDAVRAGCVLRVALEDFHQEFESAQASHVVVRARASLVANDGKVLVGQQSLAFRKNAATADVEGAVGALAAGGDDLVGGIVRWLAGTLNAATPAGQAALKQCGS
jgi:cholesterol transport system auxiliary component